MHKYQENENGLLYVVAKKRKEINQLDKVSNNIQLQWRSSPFDSQNCNV